MNEDAGPAPGEPAAGAELPGLPGTGAATIWLETLQGYPGPLQLQYSQLLNFNGLSWPHITVATLHKAA